MDEVQAFIARNRHQFGYIMNEASRQWIAKDPVGALTVGDCAAVVKHYGSYGHLLDKVVEQQKLIKGLEEENGAMAEKHAEKDIIMRNMQQEIDKLKLMHEHDAEIISKMAKHLKAFEEIYAITDTTLLERVKIPRSIEEWGEDYRDCLWWSFPIVEPPYCGTPLDSDFPDYVTHFTRLVVPVEK